MRCPYSRCATAVASDVGESGLEWGRPAKKAVVIFIRMASCKGPLARSRYVAIYCSVRPTERRRLRNAVCSSFVDNLANRRSASTISVL